MAYFSNAQEINMTTPILTYKFEQNGKRLSWKELLNIIETPTHSYNLIHKARTNTTVAAVLSVAGGFFNGLPTGQAISNKDPNWCSTYIDDGIVAVLIPFTIGAIKNVRKGVDSYNVSLNLRTTTNLIQNLRSRQVEVTLV
ncbi:MAG: hypothetical protein ABI263_06355 [Gelidibacter sp.]